MHRLRLVRRRLLPEEVLHLRETRLFDNQTGGWREGTREGLRKKKASGRSRVVVYNKTRLTLYVFITWTIKYIIFWVRNYYGKIMWDWSNTSDIKGDSSTVSILNKLSTTPNVCRFLLSVGLFMKNGYNEYIVYMSSSKFLSHKSDPYAHTSHAHAGIHTPPTPARTRRVHTLGSVTSGETYTKLSM